MGIKKVMAFQVEKLKTRQQFLALGKNCERLDLPAMLVLSKKHGENEEPVVKVGFTASKKIGNAVIRVRAKRRMRAVFDELVRLNPNFNCPKGFTVNFVARAYTLNRDYAKMVRELKSLLEKEFSCTF